MRRLLFCLLLALWVVSPAQARRTGPAEYDWGFLASRHQDLQGNWHTKAAGPLYESATSTNNLSMQAWRPLYSEVEDPAGDREAGDFLWPLGTTRDLGHQTSWRALFFFGFNHDNKTNQPRERAWYIPFYFSGRDASGQTYRAVFPLGGSIHEFLGRDEISFVLFPIRSTSRLNDLHTSNWLWPVYSVTTGPKTYRFRVFPFYGKSVREGQYEKRFVLWPFWTQSRYDHPKSSGSGFILFPVVGHMKLTDQEVWWAIPPLFKFAHGQKLDQINAPWPFYQYARSKVPGEAAHPLFQQHPAGNYYAKRYVWPLWGRRQMGGIDRTFALWPLLWWQTVERPAVIQHRFQAVPFWMSQRDVAVSNQQVVARYNKLWPLYSYHRQGDESRFRTLELWPFAETAAVERNWAPLWTLWSRQRMGDQRETEVLWGLYRDQNRGAAARRVSLFPLFERSREAADSRQSWSLLKGLLGRERVGSQVRWRLLYLLHFGRLPEEAP
jgi:hypothetical protein